MMNDILQVLVSNLFPILTIIGLIFINGFFVAAEFSLIGMPKVTIDKLVQEGSSTAKRISNILNDARQQDRYIATSQLGITLASLGLGMYGEHVIAKWLLLLLGDKGLIRINELTAHGIATVASIVLLSYMHVVIGEMIPKSLALQYTQKAAFIITPIMLIIQLVLYPLVWVFHGIGSILLKIIGINREDDNSDIYHTTEEIQYIIKESHEGGLMEEESANLIKELLEFGELTAGEVMVPRVKLLGIPLGANNSDLVEIVYMGTHTRYPIYDKDLDHIIGIMHIKDILQKIIDKSSIAEADVRDVHYISKNINLNKVFSIMRKTNTQMVVIVDDYGGTDGIITMEDIFEEVIGNFE